MRQGHVEAAISTSSCWSAIALPQRLEQRSAPVQNRPRRRRQTIAGEWINNAYAHERSTGMHVLGEYRGTSGLGGGRDQQGVPPRRAAAGRGDQSAPQRTAERPETASANIRRIAPPGRAASFRLWLPRQNIP